jgi:hypothetical protein
LGEFRSHSAPAAAPSAEAPCCTVSPSRQRPADSIRIAGLPFSTHDRNHDAVNTPESSRRKAKPKTQPRHSPTPLCTDGSGALPHPKTQGSLDDRAPAAQLLVNPRPPSSATKAPDGSRAPSVRCTSPELQHSKALRAPADQLHLRSPACASPGREERPLAALVCLSVQRRRSADAPQRNTPLVAPEGPRPGARSAAAPCWPASYGANIS